MEVSRFHELPSHVVIELDTLRALHEHGYCLSILCRPCRRHVFLDLPALIADGQGSRKVVGLRLRYATCAIAASYRLSGIPIARVIDKCAAPSGAIPASTDGVIVGLEVGAHKSAHDPARMHVRSKHWLNALDRRNIDLPADTGGSQRCSTFPVRFLPLVAVLAVEQKRLLATGSAPEGGVYGK